MELLICILQKEQKKKTIKDDATTKIHILGSIREELTMSINFITCTAFEIFIMIMNINLSTEKVRSKSIKESLKKSNMIQKLSSYQYSFLK